MFSTLIKEFKTLALMLGCSLMMAACGGNVEPEPTPTPTPPDPPTPVQKTPAIKLESSSATHEYTAGEGSAAFSIENPVSGASPEATSSTAWLKVTSVSSNGLKYSYEENTDRSDRDGTITIKYATASAQSFAVKQKGAPEPPAPPAPPVLRLVAYMDSVSCEAGGAILDFVVENPIAGEKVKASVDVDWIYLMEPTDERLEFTFSTNESPDRRNATITLSYATAEPISLVFSQAGQETPVSRIKLDSTEMTVYAASGSGQLGYFIFDTAKWLSVEAKSDASWLTVDNVSESGLTYTYGENKSYEDRKARITVTYGKAEPAVFTLTQKGADLPTPVINLGGDVVYAGQAAGKETISYSVDNPRSGLTMKATTQDEWISIDECDESHLSFSYEANPGGSARYGQIILSYGNAAGNLAMVWLTVLQSGGPVIVLNVAECEVSPDRMTYVMSYTIQNEVSGEPVVAKSDSDWLTVVGQGSNSVTYQCEQNGGGPRTGTITLTHATSAPAVFTVKQRANENISVIIPGYPSVTVPSTAGSRSVIYTIQNPVDGISLTAVSDASWLKVDEIDDIHIGISYEKNTTGKKRTAHITMGYGNAEPVVFPVEQSCGPVIRLDKTSETVDSPAGSGAVAYTIDNPVEGGKASYTCDASWLNVELYGASLEYSYGANTSTSQRTATVTLSYTDAAPVTFTLKQKGEAGTAPEIVVDSRKLRYSFAAGTYSIGVSINNPKAGVSLAASSSASWLKVQSVSNSEVSFELSQNDGEARKATITLSYTGASSVDIEVEQANNGGSSDVYFYIPTQSVNMTRAGDRVAVSYSVANCNDYVLDINASESWLQGASYSTKDRLIYFTGEQNNTGATRRCTVTVTLIANGQSVEQKFDVIQSKDFETMTLSPSVVNVSASGETVVFSITPGFKSDEFVPRVSKSDSWITDIKKESTYVWSFKVARNTGSSARTATITVQMQSHDDAVLTVNQAGLSVPDGAVDLGLPSGIFWASTNIGASSEAGTGDYFAWGETSAKGTYTWANYAWGTEGNMTKYKGSSSSLDAADDVATATLGGSWRMPYASEVNELYACCVAEETSQGGVKGVLFKSKSNGNTIFIPYTGYKDGSATKGGGSIALWTASGAGGSNAWAANDDGTESTERYLGLNVRAVYEP